jgi:OFA family oxalate/formate antiporter-like MFS transporter
MSEKGEARPAGDNAGGVSPPVPGAASGRWVQLAAGVLAMVATANLQYAWTLFVKPMEARFQWSEASIQVGFTIFVLTQAFLVPFEAWFVDRFGPRRIVAAGGGLVALSWVVNASAESLASLYAGQVIAGIGAGIVYGTSVGNALKWFSDKRGLASGITAAAFGAGAALTVVPISNMIDARGYETAFRFFGIAQGAAILLASMVLRAPGPGEAPASPRLKVQQSLSDYSPTETLKTSAFWVLYVMFTAVCTGGLIMVAQLAPIARSLRVADVPVTILGMTRKALPFALALNQIINGISRPFFGWVSDRIGRENTMFIAFSLEGLAIYLLVNFAQDPTLFVLFCALTFFAWGEIYSLFPAISGDLFGRKFATTNYALLYTAKGTASLLVPFASYLSQATGSWLLIFQVAIVLDFSAAILALFVLKPLRIRWLSRAAEPAS